MWCATWCIIVRKFLRVRSFLKKFWARPCISMQGLACTRPAAESFRLGSTAGVHLIFIQVSDQPNVSWWDFPSCFWGTAAASGLSVSLIFVIQLSLTQNSVHNSNMQISRIVHVKGKTLKIICILPMIQPVEHGYGRKTAAVSSVVWISERKIWTTISPALNSVVKRML